MVRMPARDRKVSRFCEMSRKKIQEIFWSGEKAGELMFGVPNDWVSVVARSPLPHISVDSVLFRDKTVRYRGCAGVMVVG